FADEAQLVLRRRLGEVVIDARFGGDRSRGELVIARDHHSLDTHAAQLGEALLDSTLDDVLELDDTKDMNAIADNQRRAAPSGHLVDDLADLLRKDAADRLDMRAYCACRTFADLPAIDIDAAHASMGAERDRFRALQITTADVEGILGKHHDR